MIVNFLQQFSQLNRGDTQGTIWSSKNIDPNFNQGKVNIAKIMAWRTDSIDQPNLGLPVSFIFSDGKYYAVAGARMWETLTVNPNSGWTVVSSSPTDLDRNSELVNFNNKVYLATQNDLKLFSAGFSDITGGLTSNPHPMTVYANRLYVSDLSRKIYSMDTGETLTKTGSNTIDIDTDTGLKHQITRIAGASAGIWIATVFSSRSDGEVIFWDGVTANISNSKYRLSRGALSMIIKDDRPYIIDSLGRLKVFDGTTFTEIARLPINDESLDSYDDGDNDRFIHPNGMVVVDEEILVLVSNKLDDSTKDPIERMPSGVWAYNPNYGFYHKYSIADFELGFGTQKDYGTSEIVQAGALFRPQSTSGSTIDRNEESEVFAGFTYYSDATTTKSAIGITDVDNNTQKAGYFVTAQLSAKSFDESWKEVIALHDKLKNSADRVSIKYRTSEVDPVYGTGTWAEDTRFTTTTDMSSFSSGDEIEVLRGNGSGACYTIDFITGTQIRLKENPLSSMSGTMKFRAQKWKEIGVQKTTDEYFLRRTLDADQGAWVQFKIFMVGTGKSPQLIKLISNSESESDFS